MSYFLGIDTSCYTTSIAVADEEERILLDVRKQLAVERGQRGLRQSDGVFQHIKNLPDIFSQTGPYGRGLAAVAASAAPRPAEGSYMPVFVAAASFAKAVAGVLSIRYIPSTHQHGHIYAAMAGKAFADGEYLALHVSGGTLELLRLGFKSGLVTKIQCVGGTKDLTAGQMIDRIGVKLGLDFPCGREMEKLALAEKGQAPELPVTVKGSQAHLSGAETAAYRLVENGANPGLICRSVFTCVAKTFDKLVSNAFEPEKTKAVLLFGGVCANEIIRDYMMKALNAKGIAGVFARREYSADNAAGLAIQAKRIYCSEGM